MLRPDISQKLNFKAGRCLLRHQRDVLGFDPFHPHVAGERRSRDDNRLLLDKSKERKESFRLSDVPYHDGHMINMQNHALPYTGVKRGLGLCTPRKNAILRFRSRKFYGERVTGLVQCALKTTS